MSAPERPTAPAGGARPAGPGAGLGPRGPAEPLLAGRPEDAPVALARRHAELRPGDRLVVAPPTPRWDDGLVADLVEGAGFTVAPTGAGEPELALVRERTLPDVVGPGMRLLVCGLNPSVYSADAGVGYARPGNRFWPAARAAGLVTCDRDPWHALEVDGVGMTDLVKRATRRADALDADEYRHGLDRVDRLVERLAPARVCIVGLAGWRAAVDRGAGAGPQERRLGGAPTYVMPSTSGLNAHSRLADLVEHLARAAGAVR